MRASSAARRLDNVGDRKIMLTGELIRDIGRVLPWLADVREDPAGNPSRLEGLTRLSRRVAKEAVEALASNLRHRYNAVNAAISGATNKLLDEIGSFEHGTVMDPDGAGAASSEQAEAYFRAQCEELRDLRLALNRLDSLSAPHVDTWVAFFEGRLESLLDGSRQRDALDSLSAPHVDTWVAFFEGRLESLLDGSRQRDALVVRLSRG